MTPTERADLAERIKSEIDTYCQTAYDDGPRSHLGASVIGHECDFYLWANFRWLKHKQHDGRTQRLFNRGHREEARFVEWLRGIGFQVWEVDAEGGQHRIKAVSGHFAGSLDGVGKAPFLNEPLLLEFKTSGTGKKFSDLLTKGVRAVKPVHFQQMSVYGKFYNFRYALYMCINKNDDDLHVEIVELDWSLADDLVRKASDIINSSTPPAKISKTSAFWQCKYCDMKGVCFEDVPIDRNCRSCINATPIEDGQWNCKLWGQIPSKEAILKGCDKWEGIV